MKISNYISIISIIVAATTCDVESSMPRQLTLCVVLLHHQLKKQTKKGPST